MSRKIERTFEVSASVERVWSAMTDPEELNQWYFPFRREDDGGHTTEILGEERRSEVVSFEPGRMFHTRTHMTGREGFGVAPGVREMVVVLQESGTGTRVTITHSGFGDAASWDDDLERTTHGSSETIADLVLYLETGVPFPRHHRGVKVTFGFVAGLEAGGMVVRAVQPGTFADALGLQAGDVLVALDGAGVFGHAELDFFTKLRAPGDVAEASWIRDGRLHRASAPLGAPVPVAV